MPRVVIIIFFIKLAAKGSLVVFLVVAKFQREESAAKERTKADVINICVYSHEQLYRLFASILMVRPYHENSYSATAP